MSVEGGSAGDSVRVVNDYLAKIDGISEYVIISEGFPLYWGKNIDQGRAEELAAFGVDLVSSLRSYTLSKDEGYVILGTESLNGYTGIIELGPNVFLLARKEPEVVRRALLDAYHYLHGGLKCPWCGKDISLHIVKCRKGHSLPVGVRSCPLCGSGVRYFECPHCGRLIDPDGYKVVLKVPGDKRTVGLTLGITSAVLVGLAIPLYSISVVLGSALVATAGLFLGLLYSTVERSPVRIKD